MSINAPMATQHMLNAGVLFWLDDRKAVEPPVTVSITPITKAPWWRDGMALKNGVGVKLRHRPFILDELKFYIHEDKNVHHNYIFSILRCISYPVLILFTVFFFLLLRRSVVVKVKNLTVLPQSSNLCVSKQQRSLHSWRIIPPLA